MSRITYIGLNVRESQRWCASSLVTNCLIKSYVLRFFSFIPHQHYLTPPPHFSHYTQTLSNFSFRFSPPLTFSFAVVFSFLSLTIFLPAFLCVSVTYPCLFTSIFPTPPNSLFFNLFFITLLHLTYINTNKQTKNNFRMSSTLPSLFFSKCSNIISKLRNKNSTTASFLRNTSQRVCFIASATLPFFTSTSSRLNSFSGHLLRK